jgi:hypothetical protein
LLCSLHLFDLRRDPGAVEDGLISPIGTVGADTNVSDRGAVAKNGERVLIGLIACFFHRVRIFVISRGFVAVVGGHNRLCYWAYGTIFDDEKWRVGELGLQSSLW